VIINQINTCINDIDNAVGFYDDDLLKFKLSENYRSWRLNEKDDCMWVTMVFNNEIDCVFGYQKFCKFVHEKKKKYEYLFFGFK